MSNSPTQTLHAAQVQTLHVSEPLQLHVLTGRLWITQDNDLRDHFVSSSNMLLLRPGRVVLQAEQDSSFTLASWRHSTAALHSNRVRQLWPVFALRRLRP